MQKLVSVPPAVMRSSSGLPGRLRPEWFWTCDPPDQRLGSGGGTAYLVAEAWRQTGGGQTFREWAGREKRLVIHAGGQSRRLPAYAACGKALTPVPVYRWARGQRIDQTLLDLQLPLLEGLLETAPPNLRWLVASGDVLARARLPASLPDADVLVCGLWGEADLASRHGVFFSSRSRPEELLFMRQKPSVEELRELSPEYLFQIDIGIWLFSDAAFNYLLRASGLDPETGEWIEGEPREYDLYGDFGLRVGQHPTREDPRCASFSTACVPLPGGAFYHFGRTEDLIHSSVELQNVVTDLREIQMRNIKPHSNMFVQNADTRGLDLSSGQRLLWIENATVGSGWKLNQRHVLTGVPPNDWRIDVPAGVCLDFVPVEEERVAVRAYGFSDSFRGAAGDARTQWMEQPVDRWLKNRGLSLDELGVESETDLQEAPLFPVFECDQLSGRFVCWMIAADPVKDDESREIYLRSRRLSASGLGALADLDRLQDQREWLLLASVPQLMKHAHRSVFHQIDLKHVAELWKNPKAPDLPDAAPAIERDVLGYAHDRMFRFEVLRHRGTLAKELEQSAFAGLQKHLVESVAAEAPAPVNTLLADQIVWGRSPVRLDFAGGWTDTAPYCLIHGGSVVNAAVELNGQPPIQVFARLCEEPVIVLRSIDLGESATLRNYADVGSYAEVGSGFSIPKAAFALAGFHPAFQAGENHGDLKKQLRAFGGGVELSFLAAVPKGSGLGTSSILAATVLGVLNDLCGLGWDVHQICRRTLALEQMLTTGGGWQDQYGGILRGIKQLRTSPGLEQTATVRWLPDHLFHDPACRQTVLLYYTGVTRVAKGILAEIVRGMFLNERDRLRILDELVHHSDRLAEFLQAGDWDAFGRGVRRTWTLNQALDPETNPPAVQAILEPIQDWLAGCKLLGAGGGGYLVMIAKDEQAAARIRDYMTNHPPNARARFVTPSLSAHGLQVTRS